VELPGWLQERIRQGELSCHAAARYLAPLARANKEHAELLAAHLAGMKITSRELADLYVAWKRGGDEERLTVVTRPELVLEARRSHRSPLTDEGADSELVRSLIMAGSLLQRSSRLLSQLPATKLTQCTRELLRLRWRQVEGTIALLNKQLEEALHEGPGSGDEKVDSEVG